MNLTAQCAVVVAGDDGSLRAANDIALPVLEANAVLIKVAAVALNPVDSKMTHGFLDPGCVLGLDFAGTVVAAGSDLPTWKDMQVGDRVFGCTDGSDKRRPQVGAFCQYTACRASILIKIPSYMSFETAAAMGNAIFSSGLALFKSLQLPGTLETPSTKSHWVLVYGGATATGTMAIQFLSRAGHKPIAVCSPANFAMVESYGAVKAFDYRSDTCVKDIREYTRNALTHAFDCITNESSVLDCNQAMGRVGGRYTALDPFDGSLATRKAVKADWILTIALMGRGCVWPAPFYREGDPELLAWGERFASLAERVLAGGADSLRSHPIRIMEGGIKSIPSGIDEIRRGRVRGFKLVYPL